MLSQSNSSKPGGRARRNACLHAKELVYKNFPGTPNEQLLERLIEVSLHTEEHPPRNAGHAPD